MPNFYHWIVLSLLVPIASLIPSSWSLNESWTGVTTSSLPKKAAAVFPDLYEASVTELQRGLSAGHFSSVDLVKAYFARIEEVNLKGAALRAVLETNPSALKIAAQLDLERKKKGPRSALHGIPILIKDNIATVASEGMNTTAGSFALFRSIVPRDAGVIERLRKAGAIILGKTNMSEWAHARGLIASGWSGRGGQATNAYFPNADPCGSSSGSAIAASIGLAAVTLGTETDGSIICPSSYNNLVGIKPTVGLVSRAGAIPISKNQDTIGPITRSVTDGALLLSIIAGPDPRDSVTLSQPCPVPSYVRSLHPNALRGKRLGVPRAVFLTSAAPLNPVLTAFTSALSTLRSLGATIVDPADLPSADEILGLRNGTIVLNVDYKLELDGYFKGLLQNPSGVRSMGDLIKFNDENKEFEEPEGFEDQAILIGAQATQGITPEYIIALQKNHELGQMRGIDAALKNHNIDALVLPSDGLTTTPAAVAGYPIVTVPLGFFPPDTSTSPAGPLTVYPAPNIPFGLSFIGTAFSEPDLIGFAFAYEQNTKTRLGRRAFDAAVPRTQLRDVVGTK